MGSNGRHQPPQCPLVPPKYRSRDGPSGYCREPDTTPRYKSRARLLGAESPPPSSSTTALPRFANSVAQLIPAGPAPITQQSVSKVESGTSPIDVNSTPQPFYQVSMGLSLHQSAKQTELTALAGFLCRRSDNLLPLKMPCRAAFAIYLLTLLDLQ